MSFDPRVRIPLEGDKILWVHGEEDDHTDTLPSENTSEILVESESLGSPPELIPVRRSERTTRAPNRLCLNIEVEDDELGDLGEPANYKATMLDPDKVIWQDSMDEEMNSMKVMKVWIVVDLPPNAKVVRSKWLYKKKTDMDGKVHTLIACFPPLFNLQINQTMCKHTV
nr:hypothetical protein [Tanacetum cinerariifolium]